MLKPNIECYHCHLFGHFQDQCSQQPQQRSGGESGERAYVAVEENEVDGMGFAFSAWDFSQCPQQPQQRSGGESGARAFVAIEDEGDDMGFAFSAWGLSIPEIKEEDVMEEVDLRQFWGPEYRWEDSVPWMTEHEVVIEEEVAMTAEEGNTEEGDVSMRGVSMRWALDSGASKHIASDLLLHPPQPCARGQQHQHVQRTPVAGVGVLQQPCQICVHNVLTAAPHSMKELEATEPLVKVHVNVVGPIDTVGYQGGRYFMKVVDKYSGYSVVGVFKDEAEIGVGLSS